MGIYQEIFSHEDNQYRIYPELFFQHFYFAFVYFFTGKGQKRQSRPWLSSLVFPMKSTVCNKMPIGVITEGFECRRFYAFNTYRCGPWRQRRSNPQLAQANREFRTADKSVGSLPSRPGKKENLFEKILSIDEILEQHFQSRFLGTKSSHLRLVFFFFTKCYS